MPYTVTIFNKYSDFSGKLLQLIQRSSIGNAKLQVIGGTISEEISTISDAIEAESFTMKEVDLPSLNSIMHELLLGKMISAVKVEVQDRDITIASPGFCPPSNFFSGNQESFYYTEYVLKADAWSGIFEEYDIVNQIWPIVPERVFDKMPLLSRGEITGFDEKQGRIKIIDRFGNGLHGIAQIEPAMVNPKFGISSCNKDLFEKPKCLIGACERIENSFWLYELNQHGELRRKEKKDYALYVYIAPKELSAEDKTVLQDYIGSDDVYVQGVREGWSILFLGCDKKYYILPGIHEKQDLIDLIPPSIRDRKDGLVYLNLDGSRLFPEAGD